MRRSITASFSALWMIGSCSSACSWFDRVPDPTAPDETVIDSAGVETSNDATLEAEIGGHDSRSEDGSDASAEVDGDSTAKSDADGAIDSTVDSGVESAVDSSLDTMSDADSAVIDACECAPGATRVVVGSCASVGDVQQETCRSDCLWGASTCITPSGWRTMAPAPIAGRCSHTAVWTGTQMIVWGGFGTGPSMPPIGDGAVYDLATDSWTTISPTSLLMPRGAHAAGWLAPVGKMLVWGGSGAAGALANGALFDPLTSIWTSLPASPLSPRAYTSNVVLTGFADNALWIWGGMNVTTSLSDGAIYDAGTTTWTMLPASPLSKRLLTATGWNGSRAFVWGGIVDFSGGSALGDGAMYDAAAKSWMPTGSVPPGFTVRSGFGFASTTDGLLFWGGGAGSASLDDGLRFDAIGAVSSIASPPVTTLVAPTGRIYPSTWCSASACFIWGGASYDATTPVTYENDGAVFDLSTKTWKALPSSPLSPRDGAAVVWTGKSAVIWGGQTGATACAGDGAIYTP